MQCKDIQELLMTDYMDGETDTVTTEKIRTHLAVCAVCRKQEERLKAVRVYFKKMPRFLPPDRVWENVREAITLKDIQEETVFGRVREALKTLFFSPKAVFAAGTVVTLIIFTILFGSIYLRNNSSVNGNGPVISYVTDESLDSNHDFGTELEEYFL